jgi:DNA-binding transcriptional ArsR family regulator
MATRVASQQLDRMFFALADVHRRGMLDHLSGGPASATVLAEPLGLALPSVVKHLAVLEQGGFVVSRKAGRVRTYALQPKAWQAMEDWVSKRKQALHAQFDRLDTFLSTQEKPR